MKIDQHSKHMLGHTLLRVTIGLMLLIAGIKKFQGPEGVTGMLTGLGFPAPVVFAWILILSEVIFGALVLVGYKVRYTTWPLAIILAIAVLTVTIPSQGLTSSSVWFHLIAISGLVTIALTGPGKWALSRTHP